MGIALCSIAVMVSMYIYSPWIIGDVEGGRIQYAPIWAPPMPRTGILDGVYFCVGRLLDQYMLVIIAGCILAALLGMKRKQSIRPTEANVSALSPESPSDSPLDVGGIRTKATTKDIVGAVRESRRR